MRRGVRFRRHGCSLALGAAPATADSVADFYKGKTVSLVVGYSAGGGADLSVHRPPSGQAHSGQSERDRSEHAGRQRARGRQSRLQYGPPGRGAHHPSIGDVPIAAAMGMPNVRWDTHEVQLARRSGPGRAVLRRLRTVRHLRASPTQGSARSSSGPMGPPTRQDSIRVCSPRFSVTRSSIITGYGAPPRSVSRWKRRSRPRVGMDLSALGPQPADIDFGKLVPIVQME